MLASILIATTGHKRLAEVVGVYLGQPAPVEVVVVIDGPTVSDVAVPPEFRSDQRLKIVSNDANLGLTRSLNKGLAVCTGDLVLRNDDDDLPHPDRAAKTIAFFANHPACDLAYSFVRGVHEGSGRSWIIDGPASDPEIKAALRKRNFIVHSSLAIRAERLRQLGGYDTTFRYAQDYDLYLKCIRAGFVFGCIPEVLVERSYHDDAITVKLRRRQILCSFAARLVHDAESGADDAYWRTIFGYLKLLAVPDALRELRRRAGLGR